MSVTEESCADIKCSNKKYAVRSHLIMILHVLDAHEFLMLASAASEWTDMQELGGIVVSAAMCPAETASVNGSHMGVTNVLQSDTNNW